METPAFSVIIPTRDRPRTAAACLEAIDRLDYPRDRFEVIVVDDGTRPAGAVQSAIGRKGGGDGSTRLLRLEGRGPAAARNAGVAAARFEYLAFTDDDCLPRRAWLRAFARHFEGAPESVAGGCTMNGLPDNLYSSASQELAGYFQRYWARADRPFFASNNLALSKRTFQAVEGFNAHFPIAGGEDRDFCDRVLHRGCGLHFVPEAEVDHFHALSLGKYWRQHFNYGRGAFLYGRARAVRWKEKNRRPPIRFYRDLFLLPFAKKTLSHPVRLSFLLLLSQAATALGFLIQRYGRSRP